MKKILALACAVVLSLSCLAAVAEDGEKTTLTFWSGLPENMGPRQAIDAYMELHPEIEIEFVKLGWDDASNTKLDTALMSGVGVDVVTPTRGEVEKAQKGLVLDLTEELEKRGLDPLTTTGDDAKDLMVDGKFYSLPLARLPTMWFLNKDMFDAAGIPIPTAGWTMDDMREIAKQLTTDSVYGVYFTHNWPISWLYSIPNGYISRTEVFTDDTRTASNLLDPRFLYTLELIEQMTFEDQSMLPYAEALAENYTPASVLYTEKAAMVVSASYVLRDARDLETFPHTFKVAVAPPPVQDENQQDILATYALSDPIQVCAKSPNQEAAIDFAVWLHTDGVKYFIPYGRLPANKDFSNEEVLAAFLEGPQAEMYDEDSLRAYFATTLVHTPELFGALEATQLITQETSPALVGEISAKEAIENAHARLTEYLEGQ